jgi:hypothetical protein
MRPVYFFLPTLFDTSYLLPRVSGRACTQACYLTIQGVQNSRFQSVWCNM